MICMVSARREKQWKDRWLRIIPMLKPYYMKNNPNYQNEI